MAPYITLANAVDKRRQHNATTLRCTSIIYILRDIMSTKKTNSSDLCHTIHENVSIIRIKTIHTDRVHRELKETWIPSYLPKNNGKRRTTTDINSSLAIRHSSNDTIYGPPIAICQKTVPSICITYDRAYRIMFGCFGHILMDP